MRSNAIESMTITIVIDNPQSIETSAERIRRALTWAGAVFSPNDKSRSLVRVSALTVDGELFEDVDNWDGV